MWATDETGHNILQSKHNIPKQLTNNEHNHRETDQENIKTQNPGT